MGVKNRLKEIRMGMLIDSKSEFARFLGLDINERQYHKWENGVACPNMELALQVAKKLNKRVDEIWYLD